MHVNVNNSVHSHHHYSMPQLLLQATHPGQLPEPSKGEQKSKPTQHGVRELRGLGLSPDIVSGPILSR